MKVLNNRSRSEGIRLGFTRQDQHVLDNEIADPMVQVLVKAQVNSEDTQYCTCGNEFTFLSRSQRLLCVGCGNSIDVVAHTPLVNTSQDMRPYGSQHIDPNHDEDRPFFVSLSNTDTEQDLGYEVTFVSVDERIEHRKCSADRLMDAMRGHMYYEPTPIKKIFNHV